MKKTRPKIGFIHTFAECYVPLEREVTSLPTRSLKALLRKLPNYTSTNCWWAEYNVAPIAAAIAQKELERRATPTFRRGVRRLRYLAKKASTLYTLP